MINIHVNYNKLPFSNILACQPEKHMLKINNKVNKINSFNVHKQQRRRRCTVNWNSSATLTAN